MTPLALERGLELQHEAEPGLTVIGDQTRMMQLLVNLIDNALAHTPSGGRVLVTAFRDMSSIVLEVLDTGTGISPEHLPHVFERFYRGDRNGPSRRSGAGLGLSLCLSIVRAHGGDIHIANKPGRGTQVTVRLPLRMGMLDSPGSKSSRELAGQAGNR